MSDHGKLEEAEKTIARNQPVAVSFRRAGCRETRLSGSTGGEWVAPQRCRTLSYSTGSAARFSLKHARRLTSSFMERGNLIRRPGAAHLGRRQAGRPVAHCIDARKTAVRNRRGAVSFHRARAPTDVVVHGAMRRPGAAHLSRRAGREIRRTLPNYWHQQHRKRKRTDAAHREGV